MCIRGIYTDATLIVDRSLGVRTIAIYSKADAVSQHIIDADEAVLLDGPDSAAYTDG